MSGYDMKVIEKRSRRTREAYLWKASRTFGYDGPWFDGLCRCLMGGVVLTGRGPHVHTARRGKMCSVRMPRNGEVVVVLRRVLGDTLCRVLSPEQFRARYRATAR
jgi:hypothetical protein